METDLPSYWERNVPWSYQDVTEKITYEEKRRRRYALQDYMLTVIPFSRYKGKLILEIGSGAGIDSAEFARNGAHVVSVDLTNNAVRTTMATFQEAGVEHAVARADASQLPFVNSIFDCVYSFGVLHHIPAVTGAIHEIFRILKPEGELICMLYNRNSLLYAHSLLLHRGEALTEDEVLRKYSERISGNPYTKGYSKQEVYELFRPFFREIKASVHYNVIDLPQRRKYKIGIEDELELGWHIIAICKGKNFLIQRS